MSLADTLARGIDTLGLSLSDDQQRLLLDYVDLLVKWNQAYNLTAIRDPQEMVTRHLLDSLAVLPHLGEVVGLVPFNQQVHIGQQQARLVVTQGKAQGIDAPGQGVRETHACWAAFF